MLRSDLCDYSDAYLVVKVTLDPGIAGNNAMTKKMLYLKIMLSLGDAYQKLITHLYSMQKVLILLCHCIVCWSIVTNILLHQEVCEIIVEMN